MDSTPGDNQATVPCLPAERPGAAAEAAAQDPIVSSLLDLRSDMLHLESVAASTLDSIPDAFRASARNLIHYVALRSRDIRQLQEMLVQQGLSSMGRCEAFVLANLEAVLRQYAGEAASAEWLADSHVPCDFSKGRAQLETNTRRLFHGSDAGPQIMVTMPSEAATEYALVRDLLAAGMTVMRINCAHDDQLAWLGMIGNLRQAEKELGKTCRIAMDLAGPKIRTGSLNNGPRVISWNPKRDSFGRVPTPTRVRFVPLDSAAPSATSEVTIPVRERWWEAVCAGDALKFVDIAGRNRELPVLEVGEAGLVCETYRSAYVDESTVFHVLRAEEGKKARVEVAAGRAGPIPPKPTCLRLACGDLLRITRPPADPQADDARQTDPLSAQLAISCTLPEVFLDTRPGQRVLLDDGKIAGEIISVSEQELLVKITRAKEGGQQLRADKGINFPDTNLNLPALTAKDLEDLTFVAGHADLLNYSFVRRPEDIRILNEKLTRLGHPDLGIIIKVENRQAVDNLPLLLLELMGSTAAAGVMIARGDLAVECGWERLVELQEEILWMCEAAHVPVVWATQVLERLAKQGLPTRAEVTDAGLSARAECVMLNKGPNIVETVESLSDILRRMKQHQTKKRATFRRLAMTDTLFRQFHAQPAGKMVADQCMNTP